MFSRDAMAYGGHRGGIYIQTSGNGGKSNNSPNNNNKQQQQQLRRFKRDSRPDDPVLHDGDLAAAREALGRFRWVGLMELMGTSLLVLAA